MKKCLLIVAWLACSVAAAAPLPEWSQPVQLVARDQPIDRFLQDMFAPLDTPVVVAIGVTGQVSGAFKLPAGKLLRDLARAYNFVYYYDGSALHISPASDLTTRHYVLPAADAQQALRTATNLRMTDARNTLRSTPEGALVASGTRRFVQQVDDVVRQLRPVPTAEAVIAAAPPAAAPPASVQPVLDHRVFYLRYAWAQDVTTSFAGRQTVIPGIATILRALIGLPGRNTALDYQARSTVQRLGGSGLARQGAGSNPVLGQGDEPTTRGIDVLVAALAKPAAGTQQQGAAAQPAVTPEMLVQPRIEADPRLNAVIVRDLPERLQRYADLIQALDVEPQGLELEATIIDVNTDRMNELGVAWRLSHNSSSAGFNGLNGAPQTLPPDGSQREPGGALRGGVLSLVLGDSWQFFARVSALQAEGAAKVVSSPQVMALSNVEAVFDDSSTFYVRVAGREQVDLFNVAAGTTLRVTPHVFREGDATRIKLIVQIEDGSISNRTVDNLPVVVRSGINTQAMLSEGESLLIGGMVRDSERIGEDKIPWLGNLPLVGGLFRSRSSTAGRIERLFLITPRLPSARGAVAAVQRIREPLKFPEPAPLAPAAPAAPDGSTRPPVEPMVYGIPGEQPPPVRGAPL